MKLQAFAVYDSKVEMYLRPFFAEARGAAVRSFADAVNDHQTPFYAHPDDYTLFYIGVFDQASGMFAGEAPVSLGNGLQFKTANDVKPLRREA